METTFRESTHAFEDAILEGRLSNHRDSPVWAGDFMYMGTRNGRDLFKHIATRQYLN